MTRLEFYMDQYYKELERKKNLNDSLSIPIGIVTAEIVLIKYLFNNYSIVEMFSVEYWMQVLFFLDLVFLLVATYFLATSYYSPSLRLKTLFKSSFDYYYIGLADKYDTYYTEYISYYRDAGIRKSKIKASKKLKKLILSHYIITSSHNANLNDIKSKRISTAKLFIISTIVVSVILACVVVVTSPQKGKESQNVL